MFVITSYSIHYTKLYENLKVIVPATHDTGSAVAAVPAIGKEKDWIFISSGTWSLMGVELDKPLCTEKARKFNFTNEGGVFGTTRFLKNIMGLCVITSYSIHYTKLYDC